MTDPVIEARAKAIARIGDGLAGVSLGYAAECGAREIAKSVREQLSVIRERYELVRTWRLESETSAEYSRHSSEMAGLRYAYNLIAPTVYSSEELGL